jgi:heme oxygenase (biliverdin-IX-beta and delta-forming)
MTGCRRRAPIWNPSVRLLPNIVALSAVLRTPPIPEENDALAALRGATHTHHERVDRLVDLQRLQEPSHYARVLRVLEAFLAGWEPAVAAALPPARQEWLRLRSRRPFLQQDLRALRVAPGTAARMPGFASEAAAWGAIYVMEGSALGGQVISRTLARRGLSPATGAAYFHGWGDATSAMWREVRGLLASHLDSPRAIAQAWEGARATFDALSHLLESHLHERASTA